MKWTKFSGHIAHMGEVRMDVQFWLGNPKRRARPDEWPRNEVEDTVTMDLWGLGHVAQTGLNLHGGRNLLEYTKL
jgi:hypothetical protein